MEKVLHDRRLYALAECSEAEAMLRLLSETPPQLKHDLGIASARARPANRAQAAAGS